MSRSSSNDFSPIRLNSDELSYLLELGEQLVLKLELDDVLKQVAEAACKVVNAETLVVPIIDRDKNTYTYLSGSGLYAKMIVGQRFALKEGSCGWVMEQRQPLLFGEGMPFGMDKSQQWQPGMASSLLVPLICRGDIIGGLSAMGKNGDEPFNLHDLSTLTLFANQASVAIDNARIFSDLFNEKQRAHITLQSISDAVVTTNREGVVTYLNPVAKQICQLDNETSHNKKLMDLVQFFDDDYKDLSLGDPIKECLQKDSAISLEGNTLIRGARGDSLAIECHVSPMHDEYGALSGTVMVLHDVSERRRLQHELLHQAHHDPLTNLSNRRHFNNVLESVLQNIEGDQQHAFLYLDLDNFKIINDTCGHQAGDSLLKELTGELQKVIRRADLLARLGGDEFGCLLFDCDVSHAKFIAQQLIQVIRDYRFSTPEHQFEVGVSIGMTRINSNSNNLEQILSNADVACYTAKEEGGNTVHVYDVADESIERKHGEMHWIPRIRQALTDTRFELFLQPIVPLEQKQQVAYYETLIRYRDEEDRLITPDHFIPAAERYRLIIDIDLWVCDTVFSTVLNGHNGMEPPNISINLSGASVGNDQFRTNLLKMIDQIGSLSHNLCFEITETSAIHNLVDVSRFLEQLHLRGCTTALDDFGSGLSSFGYLKELPVDILKIDGLLVKGVAENEQDYGMVHAINQIAHLLGKKTVAEWVKDEETKRCMQEIGVDYGQGYALGKPGPWQEQLYIAKH